MKAAELENEFWQSHAVETFDCEQVSHGYMGSDHEMVKQTIAPFFHGDWVRADDYRSTVEAMEARVAELEADKREANMLYGAERADRQQETKRAVAAEARVAELEADAVNEAAGVQVLRAHIAELETNQCTPAERKVLEAMVLAQEESLVAAVDLYDGWKADAAQAELARREEVAK